MNLEDKKESKNLRKSLQLRKTLEMCFFFGKKDEQKNLYKCQTLELNNRVKNAAQNLNDFNLTAKLCEGDMLASDAKYNLNCLTSLYRREKKISRTHCDDEEFTKGALVFSFRNTTSTKFEISTLTNPAPELIIITSLIQILLLNFFLASNVFARISQFINFYLKN